MSEPQRSVTGWFDRALQRLVPSRLPRAPLGFPSPLRGEVRGGGDEHKASLTGPLLAFESLRSPVWSPRDYAAFAREGFMQNAIVYRSVRMVAEAAASVPLLLYEGDQEIGEHPLLDLIARPNPVSSAPDLLESWYGFLLVSGNAYLEAVAIGGTLRELHVLRPDRMKVIPGPNGWPEAFEYTADGNTVRFTGEVAPGVRSVLHVKLFHPVNDHYGLSPEIMTGGKGLCGGVGSLGLTAASNEIAATFFGATTPTNGGNAVSAAGGIAMIETIFAEGLIDNAARMGRYFTEGAWALRDPWIGDVRFTGLLGGIELVKNRDTREVLGKAEMSKVKDHLHAQGMLITVSGLHGNVLRLQPPLSITAQQLDQFIAALRNTLRTVRGS